jgi:hypothetical protein
MDLAATRRSPPTLGGSVSEMNLGEVVEILPTSHGDPEVRLRDGTTLTLSRKYRKAIL